MILSRENAPSVSVDNISVSSTSYPLIHQPEQHVDFVGRVEASGSSAIPFRFAGCGGFHLESDPVRRRS